MYQKQPGELAFATVLYPGDWEAEVQTILQVESIRRWAGAWLNAPIAILVPGDLAGVSQRARLRLDGLQVKWFHFPIDATARSFPFATKTVAASAAEVWACGKAACLAWMDPCVLVREPVQWILPQGIVLGARPVDLALIGSRWEAPPDDYWSAIYRDCGVSVRKVFACTSSVDEVRLRSYWNAGLLVVRPERGLLRTWSERLLSLYRQPAYQALCEHDERRRIFLHQAVLAGVILASLRQKEILEFGPESNYPLHLHDRYPQARRPAHLDEVASFRYEEFFGQPDWVERLPAREPLKSWLVQRLLA